MFGKLFKRQWPYCLVSDSLSLSTRGWPKGRYLRLWSKSRYKKPRIKKKTTLEKKNTYLFLTPVKISLSKKENTLGKQHTKEKRRPTKTFCFLFSLPFSSCPFFFMEEKYIRWLRLNGAAADLSFIYKWRRARPRVQYLFFLFFPFSPSSSSSSPCEPLKKSGGGH